MVSTRARAFMVANIDRLRSGKHVFSISRAAARLAAATGKGRWAG